MLVLTRKTQQIINIGDDIKIHILDTSGKYTRIGIDAPREISVHRNEVYKQIKAKALSQCDANHLTDINSQTSNQ